MSGGRGGRYQDDIDQPIKDMEPLRKIFIGGLKDSTTDEALKEHFSQFGELSDFVVIKSKEDPTVSRKFGFVTFILLEAAHNCLDVKEHTIDGKKVEIKRACKKEIVDKIREVKRFGDKLKIFVGGLKKETTEEKLKDLFDKHDELRLKTESVSVAKNKETEESRGFAFVSFEDEDHVAQVATVVHFKIDDKQVDCRIADPKGQGRGAPGGGRGGGMRGGYGQYGGYGNGYDTYGGYGGGGYGGGGYDRGYGQGGGYQDFSGGYGNGYGSYGGGDYGYGGYNNYRGGSGGRRGGNGGGGRGGQSRGGYRQYDY